MIGESVPTDFPIRPQVSACADETKRSKRKLNLIPNIMITTKHRITFARCIDSGMSSALKIATIFKMVYDITDSKALKLTMACAEYYNETLTK